MIRTALALAVVLAPCSTLHGQATVEELRSDLDTLAAAVREKWSYYEDRTANAGLNLDQLLAEKKAALRKPDDFRLVLQQFVAALRDGHAGVRYREPWPERRMLPFRLADCAEGIVVVGVAKLAGDARRPVPGDLLVAIDGKAIEERLNELTWEMYASTPGMRRHHAVGALHGTDADIVRCEFVTAKGERYTSELPSVGKKTFVPGWRSLGENWRLSRPAEGVVCWHIWSFSVPRWHEWLKAKHEDREPFLIEAKATIAKAIDEIRKSKPRALILDLRRNGGGTDALGIHLAEHLLQDPFIYFRLSTKRNGKWSDPDLFNLKYGKGDHPRFLGKVIALVDAQCFSTTDNFLRCLDDVHPDFTVVGRPTGGGTGAPREIAELPHSGARVVLCTHRVYGPKGGLTEGRGTVPDVPVEWTREDWISGRDPDMAAALALVRAR